MKGAIQGLEPSLGQRYRLRLKRLVLAGISSALLLSLTAVAAESQTKPMTAAQYQQQWGPAVGTTVAPLAAKDQHGKLRQLADLAGPNGLLLFLVRSADW